MKKTKYNIPILVCLISVCAVGGSLMLYRAQLPTERLSKNVWTLFNKEIRGYKVRMGMRYYLDLRFKEADKIYGIYQGTRDQVGKSDLISRVEIGQPYVIYIDETAGQLWSGHNLGIRIIKQGARVVYQRNRKTDYIGGFCLLGLGLFGLFMLISSIKKGN